MASFGNIFKDAEDQSVYIKNKNTKQGKLKF